MIKIKRLARILANSVLFLPRAVYFLIHGVSFHWTVAFWSKGFPFIYNKGTIRVDKGTRLNSGIRSNPIGGTSRMQLVCRRGGSIDIGEDCGLSNCAIVSWHGVEIGDAVFIGGDVRIYDTDFHSLRRDIRGKEQPEDIGGGKVYIGNSCFIGEGSHILKKTRVEEGCVIGAATVMAAVHTQANELWAGNPSRKIRSLA